MPKSSDIEYDNLPEGAGGDATPAPDPTPAPGFSPAGLPSFSFDLPPLPDSTAAGPAAGRDPTPAAGLPDFGLPPLFGGDSPATFGSPAASPPAAGDAPSDPLEGATAGADAGTSPAAPPSPFELPGLPFELPPAGSAEAPGSPGAGSAPGAEGAPAFSSSPLFDTPPATGSFPPPGDPASGEFAAEQPAAPAAASPDATPAHLQLPAFDFSLPPLPGIDSPAGSTSGTAGAATAASATDLPAHLQLPSFPEFDLPPIPGQEPPPPPASADGVVTPPPRPPPPPPRRRPRPTPTATPALPAVELPRLAPEPEKKEVTLLASDEAEELAHIAARKRPVLPFVAIAAILAVGVGAWIERDELVATLAAKDPRPAVVETAEDRALALYAKGQEAYGKGQLEQAARSFESALELSAKFAKAHRALAIARAKQSKAAEAIAHYREYLELDPAAPDAEQVRKIISDYEKSRAAAGGGERPKNRRH